MPKRKLGSITWSKDGSSCMIQVSRGWRSDGSRRRLTKRLSGVTPEEAEIELAKMAMSLGASDLIGDSVTLRTYYYGIFRDGMSNRGAPRTQATLEFYDQAMECYVLPTLGDVYLSSITHDQVARVVLAAGSPRNCKRTLRAVLMSAYDAGYIEDRPFSRRIHTPQVRKAQTQPWDPSEVARAIEAARSYHRQEVLAYLALGLSGLRKSEALAVRPCDLSLSTVVDFATGDSHTSMAVSVTRSYTDADGVKESTKNASSVRSVPIFVPLRDDLASIARTIDPQERLVPLGESGLRGMWERFISASGLRPIPPGMLRHTSDTLALDAGVAPDLVDKMHGRSEHTSTYKNYYRPSLGAMESASHKLADGI